MRTRSPASPDLPPGLARRELASALLLLLVAGCSYTPHIQSCAIACSDGTQCPSGLTCDGRVCKAAGVVCDADGGADAANAPPDGGAGGPDAGDASIRGWIQVSSGLEGAVVNALVVDPNHPATVYAGTTTGVWKTTDGGDSWLPWSKGLPAGPESLVQALAIDPQDTRVVYAGGLGVYKTTNGGNSWAPMNNGPSGMASQPFYALAVDPAHQGYVFAGLFGPKVYRSSDAGATWMDVTFNINQYGPPVHAFAIHPSTGMVYAATYGAGLYRMLYNGTGDMTKGWTAVGDPALSLTGTGVYLNAVAFDPANSSSIEVGGDTSPSIVRSTSDGRVFGGATAPPPVFVTALAATAGPGAAATRWYAGGSDGVYSSPDGDTFTHSPSISERVNALAVDPTNANVAYAGTSKGVYKTTNGLQWTFKVSGLYGNPVVALAIDPVTTTNLYVGMGFGEGNAGLYRSTDGAVSWSRQSDPDDIPITAEQGIQAIAVDDMNPKLVWVGTLSSAWKSTNGGTSWADSGLGGTAYALGGSRSMSGTFYAGGSGSAFVIKATDSAWMTASTGLPQKDATALVVSPTDPSTAWLGLSGAGVYTTSDGGAMWTAANTSLGSMQISALAVAAASPVTLYAGSSDQGVWRSSDGGGTWSASSNGLTSLLVTTLVAARAQPGTLYLGTKANGVFRSTDGGATWTDLSAGLGSLAIMKLVVDPTDANLVYAGTWAGGVFKTAR
jgi:hypothetical protein